MHTLLCSHEAQDGEDHKASKEAGPAVDESQDDGVLVAVVVEAVVAAQGCEGPQANGVRKENLGPRIYPHLRGPQL